MKEKFDIKTCCIWDFIHKFCIAVLISFSIFSCSNLSFADIARGDDVLPSLCNFYEGSYIPEEEFLGEGTEEQPYRICHPTQIRLIANTGINTDYTLDKHYVLTRDIDLKNKPFIPITGNFTGNFNGAGFKIQNLTIHVTTNSAALFETLDTGGVIQDLGLENVDIRSANAGTPMDRVFLGSLAAIMQGGMIQNCYMKDQDDGTDIQGFSGDDSVGGLIGQQRGGSIISSYTEVNTHAGEGNDFIGGLIGQQLGGSITFSYAARNVDGGVGEDRVGGLVGYQEDGTISESYTINDNFGGEGEDDVGGLVGYQSGGSIELSYATGDSYGGDSDHIDDVGGLVGEQNGGSITSSYAEGNSSGGENYDHTGGLVGLQSGGSITASYATGNPKGGKGMRGVSIRFIDKVGGLVGYQTDGSIIASYAIGDPNGEKDNSCVGGLVGFQDGGEIISSYATGNPYGGDDYHNHVGGLAGCQNGGSIIASYATGWVDGGLGGFHSGPEVVGGLVGRQKGGLIIASYSTATIFETFLGSTSSGGSLIGQQDAGSVTASYGFGKMINITACGTCLSTRPMGVNSASGLTADNAGSEWLGNHSPWDFGDDSQMPVLRFITGATYDPVAMTVTYECEDAPTTAFLPAINITCGETLLPEQVR